MVFASSVACSIGSMHAPPVNNAPARHVIPFAKLCDKHRNILFKGSAGASTWRVQNPPVVLSIWIPLAKICANTIVYTQKQHHSATHVQQCGAASNYLERTKIFAPAYALRWFMCVQQTATIVLCCFVAVRHFVLASLLGNIYTKPSTQHIAWVGRADFVERDGGRKATAPTLREAPSPPQLRIYLSRRLSSCFRLVRLVANV